MTVESIVISPIPSDRRFDTDALPSGLVAATIQSRNGNQP